MIRTGDVVIDRRNCIVTHGEKSYAFRPAYRTRRNERLIFGRKSPRFRLIQHLLLGGGLSRLQLADLLWRDDPDGGPLAYDNIISVNLNQLARKVLPQLGLVLQSRPRPGGKVYWVEPARPDCLQSVEPARPDCLQSVEPVNSMEPA